MATGSNPSVEVGQAPDHPPPVPPFGEKWVYRTFQSAKTSTNTATGGVTFQAQDFTPNAFYLDKVQTWKLTQNSGPGLTSYFYQNLATDLGGDTVVATDFGTATSLAGMTFKVPLGHAKGYTGVGAVVDCNPALLSSGTYGLDSFVCHASGWVSY